MEARKITAMEEYLTEVNIGYAWSEIREKVDEIVKASYENIMKGASGAERASLASRLGREKSVITGKMATMMEEYIRKCNENHRLDCEINEKEFELFNVRSELEHAHQELRRIKSECQVQDQKAREAILMYRELLNIPFKNVYQETEIMKNAGMITAAWLGYKGDSENPLHSTDNIDKKNID